MSVRQLPRPLVGWPLLPVPDDAGELRWPSLEQSVRQSIEVILRTRPGEQLMHPRFGAGLERFVHEPNTVTTARRIRDTVLQSLAQWEQRIAVDSVEISEHPDKPSHFRVVITYRLRRTGATQQVGLSLNVGG
jgi:phage baseplate assembly protein W